MKSVSLSRICLTFCICAPFAAHASTLQATADATVNSIAPNMNYGGSPNLLVNANSNSLLQFSLLNLPAQTTAAQVARATITVFVNTLNKPGSLVAQFAGETFDEGTVTYNNGPGTSTASAAMPVTAAQTFVTLDVTALLQADIANGKTVVDFNLAPRGSKLDIVLDSKESTTTSHPAVLDITLVNQGATGATGTMGVAGPTGPTGPKGATGAQGPAGANGSGLGTIFTGTISLPSSNVDNGYSGPLSGATAGANLFSFFGQTVPVACTASNFNVTLWAQPLKSAVTVSLDAADGLLSTTLFTCTVPVGQSSCSASGSQVLQPKTLYGITENFGDAGQQISTSFLCQ